MDVTVTGRMRRQISRWASTDRVEAAELQRDVKKAGCCALADAVDREKLTVQGSLRTVTLRPRGGVPALEAELYDGSGTVTLVWLGRRRIAGIEPGRSVQVTGRISRQDGVRVIFNPRYQLNAA